MVDVRTNSYSAQAGFVMDGHIIAVPIIIIVHASSLCYYTLS